MNRTLSLSLSVLLLCTLLCACSTTQRTSNLPSSSIPKENLAMDPMVIEASVDKNGNVTTSRAMDASQLWKDAMRSEKRGKYEDAVKGFGLILKHFPESEYATPSLYNKAWSLENLGRWDEAIATYRAVIEKVPKEDSATDALFRISKCQIQLGAWSDTLKTLKTIEGRSGLKLYDHIEIHTRRGRALFKLGKLSEAETSYRKAIQINARAPKADSVPDHSFYISGAKFGIGRVYHQLFRDISLVLPVERMEKDINAKAELFRQAQSHYLRTIRMGNPHWGTASRYYIAKMYEDFYTDLLASEIPKDLNKEELDLYFKTLRERIEPFLKEAMRYYEKTIILSERSNIDNEYTELTQKSLERLKKYINNETLQASEQTSILKGKAPDEVGAPTNDNRGTQDAPKDTTEEPTKKPSSSRTPQPSPYTLTQAP